MAKVTVVYESKHGNTKLVAEVAVGGWVGIVCERKRKREGVNDGYPAYSEKYAGMHAFESLTELW